mmetsp:Transcript_92820/g.220660  ORF Transcript_92820/g.220660 Transcript_92820/m.220660 type:complete len:373 (+) Transcript_92820:432-1550(+)
MHSVHWHETTGVRLPKLKCASQKARPRVGIDQRRRPADLALDFASPGLPSRGSARVGVATWAAEEQRAAGNTLGWGALCLAGLSCWDVLAICWIAKVGSVRGGAAVHRHASGERHVHPAGFIDGTAGFGIACPVCCALPAPTIHIPADELIPRLRWTRGAVAGQLFVQLHAEGSVAVVHGASANRLPTVKAVPAAHDAKLPRAQVRAVPQVHSAQIHQRSRTGHQHGAALEVPIGLALCSNATLHRGRAHSSLCANDATLGHRVVSRDYQRWAHQGALRHLEVREAAGVDVGIRAAGHRGVALVGPPAPDLAARPRRQNATVGELALVQAERQARHILVAAGELQPGGAAVGAQGASGHSAAHEVRRTAPGA